MNETIELSDYEISRLYNGWSINKGNTLITFAEGSKRRKEVKQ